jgi:hypothetical protein
MWIPDLLALPDTEPIAEIYKYEVSEMSNF